MTTDYYKTLEVDREASLDVIEAAYRRLALRYHPDRNPDADAVRKMQALNEAYAVLRDVSNMIAPLNRRLPLSNQRSRRVITQQAITQTLLTAGANDQPFRSVASLVVGQMQPCDLRPFRMCSASSCLHFSEPGVVSIAGNAVKRRCSRQSSSRHFWGGGVFPGGRYTR